MKLFTVDKDFYKLFFRLSTRILMQNLMVFFTSFSDSVMLSVVGDTAVSGSYICSTVTTILQTFLTAFEGGILVIGSHLFGEKNTKGIRIILAYALRCSLLLGLAFNAACAVFKSPVLSLFSSNEQILLCGCDYLSIVCFSYPFLCVSQILIFGMRSVHKTGLGAVSSLVSLTLKLGLNLLLIGYSPSLPNMGIHGAALSTLISRIAECILCVVFTFFIDKKLFFRLHDLLLHDKKLSRSYFRCVLPIFLGQTAWSVDLFAASAILGMLSPEVVFAASVASTVNALAFTWINASANAVGLIVGRAAGEGHDDLVKKYRRISQVIFSFLGAILCLAVLLSRKALLSLYREISPLSAEYSAGLLTVLAISLLPTAYEAASSIGLIRAVGDVWFTPITDSLLVLLLVIPLSCIAYRLSPRAHMIFLCLKADHFIKPFIVFFRLNKSKKRRK